MKSSFYILLLLCLGLVHGGRDNFHYGLDYSDNDYCIYEYLSMKPNTVMTTDTCMKLTCDHTTTMIIDTCPTLTCNKDEKIVQLLSLDDVPYPQCCPKIICRRRQNEMN